MSEEKTNPVAATEEEKEVVEETTTVTGSVETEETQADAEEKQPDAVKVETTMKKITSPLTEEDKVKLGEEMSKLKIKINDKKIEKSNLDSKLNASIKELEEELLAKAKIFHEGTKDVNTECVVKYNTPSVGKKSYYDFIEDEDERLVDEEPLLVEDMTPEEKKRINEPGMFDGQDNDLKLPDNNNNNAESKVYENDNEEKLIDAYGFSPWEVVNNESTGDWFIASNPSDLDEHDIGIGEIKVVKGCLMVKSSHENIKEILEVVQPCHKINISGAISWYAFQPLAVNEESESEEQNE